MTAGNKPAIIIRLTGGLGNQMFQYAFGRALALRCGCELKLDISAYTTAVFANATPRTFMLDCFPCMMATIAEDRETLSIRILQHKGRRHPVYTYIAEPHFSYCPEIQNTTVPAYLAGYWQDEHYFAEIENIVRQDFAFPPLPEGEACELGKRLRCNPQSLAVHIRRGDYVENTVINSVHGCCSAEYYRNALVEIAKVCKEPEIFIFTDEPEWARTHFDAQGFKATVADFPAFEASPWHDMHLMSLCHHHIIANSSFSWWGAWLGAKDGVVVAPKRWFAAQDRAHDNPAAAGWMCV
jgi:hypothetical protein